MPLARGRDRHCCQRSGRGIAVDASTMAVRWPLTKRLREGGPVNASTTGQGALSVPEPLGGGLQSTLAPLSEGDRCRHQGHLEGNHRQRQHHGAGGPVDATGLGRGIAVEASVMGRGPCRCHWLGGDFR